VPDFSPNSANESDTLADGPGIATRWGRPTPVRWQYPIERELHKTEPPDPGPAKFARDRE
jgi:hypothetical protein